MGMLGLLSARSKRSVKTRSLGPIGLDLGRARLHLVQMAAADGCFTIHAAASLAYPCPLEELLAAPKAFAAFVRQALKSTAMQGRKIVTCLPNGDSQVINLKVHHHQGKIDEKELVEEVASYLGGAAADYVIDYLPVRNEAKSNQEQKVLAVAANREKVVTHLELLRKAGLDVLALDVGPVALCRMVSALDLDENHPTLLLVNVDKEESCLTAVSGRRLVTDREVHFGETAFVDLLGKSLQIDTNQAEQFLYRYGFEASVEEGAAEQEIANSIAEILQPLIFDLAEEINKTLVYLASEIRGQPVQKIYLFGRLARYPGGTRLLARTLSLPVEVFNPLEHFSYDANLSRLESPAGISCAAGFALRGMVHE